MPGHPNALPVILHLGLQQRFLLVGQSARTPASKPVSQNLDAVRFIAFDPSLQTLDVQVVAGSDPLQRLLAIVCYQRLQTGYSPEVRAAPTAFLDLLDRSF